MARKSVFSTLIAENGPEDEATVTREPPKAAPSRAVQGMRDSLRDLQKASAQDIPVEQIMDSVIRDRIDLQEGIDDLITSFHRDGQEVPIKVRMVPGDTPYEIVVGRRRLAAARALKWKHIRGFVVELDDKAMLKALTTENTARLDNSFIGRSQMTFLALERGHTQMEVGELLGISQSLVSFMLRVYHGVGHEVINAIGDAPGIGRKRWQTLQKLIEASDASPAVIIALMSDRADQFGDDVEQIWQRVNGPGTDRVGPMPPSTKRFEVLLKSLKDKAGIGSTKAAVPAPKPNVYLDGAARSLRRGRELVIKVDDSNPEAILDFLEERLPEIMEGFKNRDTP